MTDEELIAWVRNGFGNVAADRIEALVKERDQWIEHTKNAVWSDSEELKLANDRIKGLEAALQKLACNCPSNCDWEHGDICPSWIARAALKGADHV